MVDELFCRIKCNHGGKLQTSHQAQQYGRSRGIASRRFTSKTTTSNSPATTNFWRPSSGPVPTQFFVDASQSIIAKNNSPDVFFNYIVNAYRGCENTAAHIAMPGRGTSISASMRGWILKPGSW